jgi:hypothetical protein
MLSSRQRGCYTRAITARVRLGENGSESQGASSQDEIIGGEPPVVK